MRAQISIYIIAGILLIGILFVMFYISGLSISDDEAIIASVPSNFDNYIEECLLSEAKPLIKEFGIKGATLEDSMGRIYQNTSYSFLCTNTGSGCINTLRTRTSMQNELDSKLLSNLVFCLDLDSLEDLGYEIEKGEMELKSTITANSVDLNLIFPLKISNDETNFEKDNFRVSIKTNLGMVYDLAIQILNSEILEGNFDKNKWMDEHGGEAQIKKYKPYPDTLYSLQMYYEEIGEVFTFNFAVQGIDTISRVDSPTDNIVFLGACKTSDNNCYANVDQSSCGAALGDYSQIMPSVCNGLARFSDGCLDGETCNNCGSRSHGETWCEYDSVVGSGLDYVGSRQYLRSCYDGIIYYEDCRDFREEICVEEGNTTSCRTNRWADCVLQNNQDDCENLNQRDCKWNPTLTKSYVDVFENRRCHPIVPPGLKHWQLEGFSVCQMANEYNDCDGISCPDKWTDDSARYCYSMADCGAYRNIADKISTEGFFNSNREPREYIYLDDGLINEGQNYVLDLPINVENNIYLSEDPYYNEISNINTLLFRTREFLDETSSWSKDDFIWQYITEGEIDYWTRHLSMCAPYNAPVAGDCHLCHQDNNKPCTEYKCKSIGSSCIYEEVDGFGRCFDFYGSDGTPPQVSISSIGEGYTYEDAFLGFFRGVEVMPEIYPHNVLSFKIETSEDTQCKISFLPLINYTRVIWPSTSFDTNHEFTYQVPNMLQITNYLTDILDLLTLLELGQIDQIQIHIESIKQDARETAQEFGVDITDFINRINEFENNFNTIIRPQIEAFILSMENVIDSLLIELDSSKHTIFIKCIDRAGNQNEEYFIRMNLNDDNLAPQLIRENNKLVEGVTLLDFTLNEESTCRYGFSSSEYEEMQNEIPCKVQYENNIGHYNCKAEAEFFPSSTSYFVKCKDNPPNTRDYAIHTKLSTENNVYGANSHLIILDENLINVTNDFAIKNNDTVINSTYLPNGLSIKYDENSICKFDNFYYSDYELYQNFLPCNGEVCESFVDPDQSYYISCKYGIEEIRNLASFEFTISDS